MPEEAKDSNQGQSALIVEDDQAVLSALTLQLRDRGWRIVTATDSQKAQQLFQKEPTALALIDLALPDLDAVDLAQDLRLQAPDLIVVFLTGFPQLNDAIEGVYKVAYDYLIKPFRVEQLLLIIQRARRELNLIKENRALSETVSLLQSKLSKPAPEPQRLASRRAEATEVPVKAKDQLQKDFFPLIAKGGYGAIASYERQMTPIPVAADQGPATEDEDQSESQEDSGDAAAAGDTEPESKHGK